MEAFSRFDQDREEDVEKAEFADPVPRPQNTRTIAIERFVPAGQVDLRYFERARGRPR
jgi:DNA end-binding protein Ku